MPMIDADALMTELSDTKYAWQTYDEVEGALRNIPTIEAEPVRHGRWGTHSDRPDSLICSVCKCGFDMWKHDPHNYCPNCGAKMDKE